MMNLIALFLCTASCLFGIVVWYETRRERNARNWDRFLIGWRKVGEIHYARAILTAAYTRAFGIPREPNVRPIDPN